MHSCRGWNTNNIKEGSYVNFSEPKVKYDTFNSPFLILADLLWVPPFCVLCGWKISPALVRQFLPSATPVPHASVAAAAAADPGWVDGLDWTGASVPNISKGKNKGLLSLLLLRVQRHIASVNQKKKINVQCKSELRFSWEHYWGPSTRRQPLR